MRPRANPSGTHDASLLAGTLVYTVMNVTGVLLTAVGAIHPSSDTLFWRILCFFAFIGPTLAILGVFVVQASCRPFTWTAVLLFGFTMLLAALMNSLVLGAVSGAV